MYIKLFLLLVVYIGFANQMFYGLCFTTYCLSAATPKVLIFTIIAMVMFSFNVKNKNAFSKQLNTPLAITVIILIAIVYLENRIVPCTTDSDCEYKNPNISNNY